MSERANQTAARLDEFEKGVGLPPFDPVDHSGEASSILSLPPSRLSKLTATECGEYAFILRQFGLHVQRALNREAATVKWAEESVRKLVAPHLMSTGGYGPSERLTLAVAGNDAAKELERLRVEAQLKVERLSYVTQRVAEMADSLEKLQFTKRGSFDD